MSHESWNLTGDQRPRADDKRATHKALANEFDAWAEAGRGDDMERGHLPTASQALAQIPFEHVRVFLDVGTGNGFAVRYAAERMRGGSTAIGLDVSPRMVAAARQRTAEWATSRGASTPPLPDIQFVEATFETIPVPPATVDVVYSNEAIYYAPDLTAALRSIRRALRDGGRLHLTLDFYTENTQSHDWPEKVGVPMVLRSEAEWGQALEATGFHQVRSERLFDARPLDPLPDDADPEAHRRHADKKRWRTEIGTLHVYGTADPEAVT